MTTLAYMEHELPPEYLRLICYYLIILHNAVLIIWAIVASSDKDFNVEVSFRIVAKTIIALIGYPICYFIHRAVHLDKLFTCPSTWLIVVICILLFIIFFAINMGLYACINGVDLGGHALAILATELFTYYLIIYFGYIDTPCFAYYVIAIAVGCYFALAIQLIEVS